jgi:hypothetical protein
MGRIKDYVGWTTNGTGYWEMQVDGANQGLRWLDDGSERLRITSAGLVGIGTSAPVGKLAVGNSSNNFLVSIDSSASYAEIQAYNAPLYINRQGNNTILNSTSGNVGIGNTAPQRALHVSSAASEQVVLSSTSGSLAGIFFEPNGTTYTPFFGATGASLVSYTSGAERCRVDDSGRLLVGTSTARSNLYGSSYVPFTQFESSGATTTRGVSITYNASTSTAGPILSLISTRGTSAGSNTLVASGDEIGFIDFMGTDGTKPLTGAAIFAQVDGTPGANDMPGRLVFSTTADGASSPTERVRIDSTGRTLIGTAAPILSSASLLQVSATANAAFFSCSTSAADVIGILNAATTGDNIFVSFGTEAGFTSRGTIDYNRAAGQVRYNVTSDRRLKSNIEPAASALDNLSALQVRAYKWAETDYQVNYGFVAQELNEVVPDAVKVGDDGEEVTDAWSVDTGKLVPLLTKALQEAIGEIESLKARLTAAGI